MAMAKIGSNFPVRPVRKLDKRVELRHRHWQWRDLKEEKNGNGTDR
jgi:hypothetical protein